PTFPARFNVSVSKPVTPAATTTTTSRPETRRTSTPRRVIETPEEDYEYSTEEIPVVPSSRPRLPPPDLSKQCALPQQPAADPDVNSDSGFRFGNSKDSRMEFQTVGDLKRNTRFSVSFKTYAQEGVIFYVSDKSHTDKIALFLKNGSNCIYLSITNGEPKFVVGKKMKLQMDIKPRTNDGILMAVHGSSGKDYMVLQLIDGALHFIVDNGAGSFNCSLKLDDSVSLCDGNWHNILVVKILNLATLAIDGVSGQAGVGKPGVFVTNTEDPLYVGGHPNPVGLPGFLTTDQYVGCIRKLSVNSVSINLSDGQSDGKVFLNSCPTI
ncbi:unnamed protein product, partial [Notodromas monacha]